MNRFFDLLYTLNVHCEDTLKSTQLHTKNTSQPFFIFFFLEYGEPFFAGGEAPALYSFNKYFNKKIKKYRTLRVFVVYITIYIIYSPLHNPPLQHFNMILYISFYYPPPYPEMSYETRNHFTPPHPTPPYRGIFI